jgi:hypothetical protein
VERVSGGKKVGMVEGVSRMMTILRKRMMMMMEMIRLARFLSFVFMNIAFVPLLFIVIVERRDCIVAGM